MRKVKLTDDWQISLSKDIKKKFKKGSEVVIFETRNGIEIISLDEYFERNYCSIMSEKSLAKDWLSKEDEEAWKDL